ncbi:YobA family protein [Chryseomicrobium palamuruense]
MKMQWLYILVVIFFLAGCQQSTQGNDEMDYLTYEGTIVAVEDGRFLVVNGASEEDIETLEPLEIVLKHNKGVWFTYESLDEIGIGITVRVIHEGTEDSLPGYGEAIEVEVLQSET